VRRFFEFFNKIPKVVIFNFLINTSIFVQPFIVLPELQRFYGRTIVIITPVEMPIRDINRPLSIIIFVLYLSVYRVVLGRIYD
jgi:hypothetical protein